PVAFAASRQAGSAKMVRRSGMASLFYSFGTQNPGQLVLNNYPRFMTELSIPGNPVFDVGAVDVLRARERGVPRYNEFRRQLGLNPIRTWEDLTPDAVQVERLKEVYGDGADAVEKLDLMVGTLAEGVRPTGFGFGETLFQIFILNASRRLQADRFYTDSYNEDTYTAEGLEWIDDADLKGVILRHYPELGATGLANVKNAFEPWDVGEQLDPQRHPLRAFDKELGKDRWRTAVAAEPTKP
ncbi:MAG: peroxidase family protein, partial [Tepidiformaceae bacterium]